MQLIGMPLVETGVGAGGRGTASAEWQGQGLVKDAAEGGKWSWGVESAACQEKKGEE